MSDTFARHLCCCVAAACFPVMLHTCGSSSWAYEDYIEMGLKAVDTLQPEATNINPKYLKAHFGGRLVFHGCISTTKALSFGYQGVHRSKKRGIDYFQALLERTNGFWIVG